MITWDKPAGIITVCEGWLPHRPYISLVEGDRVRKVSADRFRGCVVDKIIIQSDAVYEEFVNSEIGRQIIPCVKRGGLEILHKNYVKFKLKKLKFI
jgi:hypothetical protein